MNTEMTYRLHDKPPLPTAIFVAFQHVLAVFGGVITVPLITALGMGLSMTDTSYLVSASLVISGVATFIQINRFGPVGSGLLSIQGTSFTFIGPLIFAYTTVVEGRTPQEALGVILGCCALCALCMVVLSQFIHKLQRAITTNVSGATVILIGLSLIWTTVNNVQREFNRYEQNQDNPWLAVLLAICSFSVTLVLSRAKKPMLRIASITVGLISGFLVAWALGLVNFSSLDNLNRFFLPAPAHFPLSFDLGVFFLLLPVFVISSTETVGDLTATSRLSGLQIGDREYWQRIRGGVTGDAFNSFLAAIFCTFPNTSFSQNNGVIRLTGVASPFIGVFTAGFLVLLGVFPIVGGLFIVMPSPVLYGATILMFFLVFLSGLGIVSSGDDGVRSWPIVIAAVGLGFLLSATVPHLEFLPRWLKSLLQFPISTGAIAAFTLELVKMTGFWKGAGQPA